MRPQSSRTPTVAAAAASGTEIDAARRGKQSRTLGQADEGTESRGQTQGVFGGFSSFRPKGGTIE